MFNPYALSREPIYARDGMVATSQPLAALAGLEILKAGGNAIDAAIATAAALTVVEPTSNGIGSDAFALIWHEGELFGANGSGRSPQNMSLQTLSERGLNAMPEQGWLPVNVCGAVRLWADVHQRFGMLPFAQVLAPAIHYARAGYPLSPVLAENWQRAAGHYHKTPETEGWFETFMPQGFTPRAGEMWQSESHAQTLEHIAQSAGEELYSGKLAQQMAQFARDTGGIITLEDLAAHRTEWVKPISAQYQDHTVWEIPPNGHGLVALEALSILQGCDLGTYRENPEALHLQIEATKLAFADGLRYIADPAHVHVPVGQLLAPEYIRQQRERIQDTASIFTHGDPTSHGTVYLCTADKHGNMVSLIQSNYMGFGSGVVVPHTGIALHNRGHNFSLDPSHPNCLAPRKRPYHTIIPGFLTRDNTAISAFGVMGGFMQPQGHVQMMVNTLNYGLNPQAALDAPRWQWIKEKHIQVEQHMPRDVIRALQHKGHHVEILANYGSFGRGQMIWRLPNGVYTAGTDSRTDGVAIGF